MFMASDGAALGVRGPEGEEADGVADGEEQEEDGSDSEPEGWFHQGGFHCGLLRFGCEQDEEASPSAFGVVDGFAHTGAGSAVALDVAVLELDEGGAVVGGGEADLDLAAFGELGLELPVGVDLPGHDEAVGRIPDEDGAPGTDGSVLLIGVDGALGAGFDDYALHGGGADVVGAGPPGVHLAGEDTVGVVGGGFYADALEDGREGFGGGQGFGFGGGHLGWHGLFLLYFGFEGFEGCGPEAVEVGPEVGEAFGVELVVTAGSGGVGLDELGLLEDAEVLGDGRAGDGEVAG